MLVEVNMYGLTASDTFPIDELLDFSNEELFSSADYSQHPHLLQQNTSTAVSLHSHDPNSSTDFTDDLRIPVRATLNAPFGIRENVGNCSVLQLNFNSRLEVSLVFFIFSRIPRNYLERIVFCCHRQRHHLNELHN